LHKDNYKTVCATVYILCPLGKSVQLRIMECTNNIRYGSVDGFKIAQLELKGQKICDKYISTIQIKLYVQRICKQSTSYLSSLFKSPPTTGLKGMTWLEYFVFVPFLSIFNIITVFANIIVQNQRKCLYVLTETVISSQCLLLS
jgi:hypothetical protein